MARKLLDEQVSFRSNGATVSGRIDTDGNAETVVCLDFFTYRRLR